MSQEKGEMDMRLAEEALNLSAYPAFHRVLGFIRCIIAVVAIQANILAHALLLAVW